MKVPELFTIDPSGGYFDSPLRGFRWSESGYIAIEPGQGPGLHSEVLGLNLAREGYALCLFDPTTGRKLPTVAEELDGAETMRVQIEKARRLIAAELDLAETRRRLAEQNLEITEAQLELAERQIEELKAENECLRREIEGLRQRPGTGLMDLRSAREILINALTLVGVPAGGQREVAGVRDSLRQIPECAVTGLHGGGMASDCSIGRLQGEHRLLRFLRHGPRLR